MLNRNAPIPQKIRKTNIFDTPDAQCELTLDGYARRVSVVLQGDYCYLQVAGLSGLWGITQPYDQTDLVSFVQNQVEEGEVGRVWNFNHSFSNFDPATRTFTASHHEEPLIIIGLTATIRFDNSALVRTQDIPLVVETPAFNNNDRRHRQGLPATKANRPSIWHPKRKLVGKQQIGNAARALIYQQIPEAELQANKTGSISDLIRLLEALFICASVTYKWNRSSRYHTFHWPEVRGNLRLSYDLQSRIDLTHFLYLLWDYHHYKAGSWIPARYNYGPSLSNQRYEWQRAEDSIVLSIPRHPEPTAHQKIEASLTLYNWFKDKTSERELNKLLPENL